VGDEGDGAALPGAELARLRVDVKVVLLRDFPDFLLGFAANQRAVIEGARNRGFRHACKACDCFDVGERFASHVLFFRRTGSGRTTSC